MNIDNHINSLAIKNVNDSWSHPNLEDLNSVELEIKQENQIDTKMLENASSISSSSVLSTSALSTSAYTATPGSSQKLLFQPCDPNVCEKCAKDQIITPEHNPGSSISYKKMSNMLNDMYYNSESEKSIALDIISIYLKGQKILYTEAKTYCEQILNSLMLPAILIAAISTVLSIQLHSYTYGGTIVSILSASNTFIISLISYLKLDAKAESHKIASHKFDKIQSLCEFKSGKILLLDKQSTSYVSNILTEIESQVKDIKETNQFILPERIRYRFPLLYSTNVFSIVKKLRNDEIVLTNKLTTIVNKMIQLNNNEQNEEIQLQLVELEKQQNEALEEIIHFRDRYLEIDTRFNSEIETYINETKKKCNIFHWLKT